MSDQRTLTAPVAVFQKLLDFVLDTSHTARETMPTIELLARVINTEPESTETAAPVRKSRKNRSQPLDDASKTPSP